MMGSLFVTACARDSKIVNYEAASARVSGVLSVWRCLSDSDQMPEDLAMPRCPDRGFDWICRLSDGQLKCRRCGRGFRVETFWDPSRLDSGVTTELTQRLVRGRQSADSVSRRWRAGPWRSGSTASSALRWLAPNICPGRSKTALNATKRSLATPARARADRASPPYVHIIKIPPLALTVSPVMKLARSDSRNDTTSAISSG